MATVVIADPIHEAGIKLLQEAGMEVLTPQHYPAPEETRQLVMGAEAVIVRTFTLGRDLLEQCSRLKVIGKHGVGVDNIDVGWATSRQIPVVFTPGAATEAVAEQAIALMLAVAKKITRCDAEMRRNNYYIRDAFRTAELWGKVLGLIGCGRIGSLVGRIGRYGFNMQVLVYDPYLPNEELLAGWASRVTRLEELLREADCKRQIQPTL